MAWEVKSAVHPLYAAPEQNYSNHRLTLPLSGNRLAIASFWASDANYDESEFRITTCVVNDGELAVQNTVTTSVFLGNDWGPGIQFETHSYQALWSLPGDQFLAYCDNVGSGNDTILWRAAVDEDGEVSVLAETGLFTGAERFTNGGGYGQIGAVAGDSYFFNRVSFDHDRGKTVRRVSLAGGGLSYNPADTVVLPEHARAYTTVDGGVVVGTISGGTARFYFIPEAGGSSSLIGSAAVTGGRDAMSMDAVGPSTVLAAVQGGDLYKVTVSPNAVVTLPNANWPPAMDWTSNGDLWNGGEGEYYIDSGTPHAMSMTPDPDSEGVVWLVAGLSGSRDDWDSDDSALGVWRYNWQTDTNQDFFFIRGDLNPPIGSGGDAFTESVGKGLVMGSHFVASMQAYIDDGSGDVWTEEPFVAILGGSGTSGEPPSSALRPHYQRPVRDASGNIRRNVVVSIYRPGTTDLISEPVYPGPTGLARRGAQHHSLDGEVDFYLDAPAIVDIEIVPLDGGQPVLWQNQWVGDPHNLYL